ncbi:MAG: flavodoxin-dependent (E)-4-hydroxy-3-methylbut-2-enyl-diphosphate synthase [Clostridiales bacterium]|nr:flavodoxin-dependent (E)-4-hydroxy-3-methylbut-2-enyl-diphosphate synthase [Clostridiales bacterium]
MKVDIKEVKIRNIAIGGSNPIAIQSMTNLPVTDVDGTLRQMEECQNAGCDIMRIAVPDMRSAEAFGAVRKLTNMALVADIHFDYRLALAAMEAGADKIRVNPGNMSLKQLDSVIDCAKAHSVPIRIGVNSGSVNKEALVSTNGDKCRALALSLEQYVRYFEGRNFTNLVLSVKSTDVRETVQTNRIVSKLGYPVHLGVTEAGLLNQGLVKNSIGIGSLLLEGIGDTVRVSLTSNPIDEVYAAKDILVSLGLRPGVTFVSCPKCGRCSIDLERVAAEIYDYVKNLRTNVKIAVMGCEVNGPGECSDADLGMAGANGGFVFFKHGKRYKTVAQTDAISEFKKEIDLLTNDNR